MTVQVLAFRVQCLAFRVKQQKLKGKTLNTILSAFSYQNRVILILQTFSSKLVILKPGVEV